MSKSARRFRRGSQEQSLTPINNETPRTVRADKSPLKPQTENQRLYLASIEANDITLGLGPAGTGKTYVAAAWAAERLAADKNIRLIVTRPSIEIDGEEQGIGFLPGEMGEKFAPYFAPVRAILEKRLGPGHVEGMMKSGRIEIIPLGFIRGHTFEDTIVLLDEAQNTTPKMMKTFLTRLGRGAKLIINGDLMQSDIRGPNGLFDAKSKLRGLKGCGQITFTREDIVRHGLVRQILDRYEGPGEAINDDSPVLPEFLRRPS